MACPSRSVADADDGSVPDAAAVCGRFVVRGLSASDVVDRLVLGAPVVRINGAVIARGFPRSLVRPDALVLTGHSRRGDTTTVTYRYHPGGADLGFLTAGDMLTVSYRVRLSDDLDAPTLHTVVIDLGAPAVAPQPAPALPVNGGWAAGSPAPGQPAGGRLNQTSGTGGTVLTQSDGQVRFQPSIGRHGATGLAELMHWQPLPRWPGAALWWSWPSVWLWTAPPQGH